VTARPIVLPRRDFYSEQPIGDQPFAIYRRVFDYDPAPLDATVDETDSTDTRWIRERVSFRAAYGNERVLALVFLPRGAKPPYQTVIFFAGANALFNRSSKDLGPGALFDFVVKSGRAFIYPVYKSTYERGDEVRSIIPSASNAYKEHVIMWAKDLRRAVDYAETRPDLDAQKLAYLGQSWGGSNAAISIVAEPRIKVAVLNLAGLFAQRAQPEADAFNYVSRVKIPVLVLSGRYDPIFPLETAALPFFRLLGTPAAHKRHVITESGHFTPRPVLIRETLDWLDRYVGPVKR
jgi:pimeloyl-ACP methyl ester carboxylesterase